jgi:hypothetical protein
LLPHHPVKRWRHIYKVRYISRRPAPTVDCWKHDWVLLFVLNPTLSVEVFVLLRNVAKKAHNLVTCFYMKTTRKTDCSVWDIHRPPKELIYFLLCHKKRPHAMCRGGRGYNEPVGAQCPTMRYKGRREVKTSHTIISHSGLSATASCSSLHLSQTATQSPSILIL